MTYNNILLPKYVIHYMGYFFFLFLLRSGYAAVYHLRLSLKVEQYRYMYTNY